MGCIYATPSNRIHTTPIFSTRYYNPLPTHSSTLCQKVTMNRKLDLPILMRPSTPSNLWSTTPIKNRPPSPMIDDKILPSHWSSNTHLVIKKMMEDLLRLKKYWNWQFRVSSTPYRCHTSFRNNRMSWLKHYYEQRTSSRTYRILPTPSPNTSSSKLWSPQNHWRSLRPNYLPLQYIWNTR